MAETGRMIVSQGLLVKRALLALLGLAIAAAFYLALRPQPVAVDTAAVSRGSLAVTVDEEGKTQIKDVYVVSAPITGTVLRAPVHVGDTVEKDSTVVAVIRPQAPTLIDVRSRAELETAVKAAEAGIALAEAELAQARSEMQFAETDLVRTETLTKKEIASERALQKAKIEVETRTAAVARGVASVAVRRRELESARVRLMLPDEQQVRRADGSSCCYDVKSPESGRVLRLLAESEKTVLIGTPLIEIGNTSELEVSVELLSSDAVKVQVGARATIDGWGGPPLAARVKRIDPSGFTKVSALGIEEQRVKTLLAFTGPQAERERLGHDFRVFAQIKVFEAQDALRVPLSALFRRGESWAAFVLKDGTAHERKLEIGERNSSFAEVRSGLEDGERIILHPNDQVSDGVRVVERLASQ